MSTAERSVPLTKSVSPTPVIAALSEKLMPVPSFFRVAMPVRGGPGIRPRSAWPRAQPRGIGARDPEVALREPLRVGDPEILPTGFRKSSRTEEHTSELQSLMRISYAVFCLKKKSKQRY